MLYKTIYGMYLMEQNLLLNALKIFDTSKKGVIEKVEC